MSDNWVLTSSPDAKTDPVFVGVGEIPSGKYPDRSFIGDLTEVAIRALHDASMSPNDVDTILLIPNLHSSDDQADLIFSRMVEELGLSGKAKSSMMLHSGARPATTQCVSPRDLSPPGTRKRSWCCSVSAGGPRTCRK